MVVVDNVADLESGRSWVEIAARAMSKIRKKKLKSLLTKFFCSPRNTVKAGVSLDRALDCLCN